MSRRRKVATALGALVLGSVIGIWIHKQSVSIEQGGIPGRSSMAQTVALPSAADASSGAMEVSPIADLLTSPSVTPQRDVALVEEVLEAWRTNFPGVGNPVGENREICRALTGQNPLRYAFLSPTHRALNSNGELCDRWGTPFRFHALSGTHMVVTSAGPDRRFRTPDDLSSEPEAEPSN